LVGYTQVLGGIEGRKGSPFSADVVQESTKTLGYGNPIQHKTRWKLFRDVEGRTRGEFSEGKQFQVRIIDSVGKVMIVLDPKTRTATINHFDAPPQHPSTLDDQAEEQVPGMKQERLEDRDIQGFRVSGFRYSQPLNTGQQGHGKVTIVIETWYSQDLKATLLTTQEDSQSGRSLIRLTNIRRGDPDPQLFRIPSDYTLKEVSSQQ